MNWKIILLLVLLGVAIAIASLFGLVNNIYVWASIIVIAAIISGFVIAKNCSRSIFMHGVIVGLFSGILGSVIQSLFFDTYLENNKESLDGFKNLTEALAPQYVILFSGPFIGIAYGIVIGLIAIVFSKMTSKKDH